MARELICVHCGCYLESRQKTKFLCYINTYERSLQHQFQLISQSIQTFLQQSTNKFKNNMFKLVVLSALLAVAAARPGLYESPLVYAAPATVAVHEPAYAKVGAIVKSVPTSVSHSSSSVVHSSAHVVEDVLAPAVKTTHVASAPVVHSASLVHSAPLVHSSPLVHSASLVHSDPVYKTYAAHGPVYRTYAASPYVHSPYTSYAGVSPLSYTATGLW